MSIQFCVVRQKESGLVLANGYDHNPGYNYSEYTRESSYTSINKSFQPIEKLFGPQDSLDGYTVIIFENKDSAQEFIIDYCGDNASDYEVLSFAEIDAIVEAHLLGNSDVQIQ
jgi:hypothetical protein